MVPLEQFTSPAGDFVYHTFFCCVAEEFRPTLNYEHLGYAWINSLVWPKPMHPGLWSTVNFDAVQNKVQTITNAIHTSQ
jgi:glutathionyl-hydroquinone reductase